MDLNSIEYFERQCALADQESKEDQLELIRLIRHKEVMIDSLQEQIVSANKQYQAQKAERELWGNINQMSLTDPVLKDMLERVIVYYNLKVSNE